MRSLSCVRTLRVGAALFIAMVLSAGPAGKDAAMAAENPTVDTSAADYDAQMRDLDTQMRNVLNTPTDFCDPAAREAQNRAYTNMLFEKYQLQRQHETIHPTIRQDVQKVVQAIDDDGMGRGDTPVVEEYGDDMRRSAPAAAAALLPRMTPWEQARAAEIRNDYAQALKILAPLADQGDVRAQVELGSLYSWGTVLVPSASVLRDDAQALKYLRLAAANGEVMSQELLAKHYACGIGTTRDLVQAYAWFSLAVARSAVTLQTGYWPEEILRERDFLAGEMSHDDIQRAKHLLIQCHQSQYKACD